MAARKLVNLALQGGGSHGAYTWGALDALLEDERIEIGAISGASAGAMNAAVFASGLLQGGREGARSKLYDFWLSVSAEGSLTPAQRRIYDTWFETWRAALPQVGAMWDTFSTFVSPYDVNPLDLSPLRDHLVRLVDFEALRREPGPELFVAATNVHSGRGEIFRRGILTPDHVMASACLPRLFRAVEIDGAPYWDGGYAGNPPLWPLFYETDCRDTVIVQINPIERVATPRTAQEIADRVNEITFNAALLGELRAADFVARLIERGALKGDEYRREFLHRIGGAGALERFGAGSKFDVTWSFLTDLRDLGRQGAREWLDENFAAIGERSTLDISAALRRQPEWAGETGKAALT
jgi:NTE family protein